MLEDTGSPVLFNPGILKMVEGSRLTDWVSKIIDSVEYAGPLEFSHPGLWEDLHKHDPATVRPSPDISTGT